MIKYIIFDLSGNEIYVARRCLPLIIPQPGMTERNADDVWNANVEAISEAINKSGIFPEDILAIDLTGYGNGVCFIDKDGKPTENSIVFTDSSTSNYLTKWGKNGVEQKVYNLT